MKTIDIEELKANQLKQVAKAEEQNKALLVACAYFNDIQGITPYAYGADYGLTLTTVETLQDAIERGENINPDALFSFKDSCLSFMPEEFAYNKRGAENAKIECVGAWVYEVERMTNSPQQQKLVMYKTIEDYMFKITIPVAKDDLTYITEHHETDRNGRVINTRYKLVNLSGHFHKVYKYSAPKGTPNSFKLV